MPNEPTADEERRLLLMQATAEALAMPEMICRHRGCRRAHACHLYWADQPEPICLELLWPWQRAMFDELHAIVAAICDGRHPPRPSADPSRVDLEVAAANIIGAVLRGMPEIEKSFGDWCRRYAAQFAPPPPPAPRIDTGALLAEMKATLARDRREAALRGL